METYRIARDRYTTSLVTSGRAGRWNKDNQQVIYAGQSRALASLELLAHKNSIQVAFQYKTMVVQLAESESLYTRLKNEDLPTNWRSFESYPITQTIGNNWYTNNQSLILQVPSALIPNEYNYLINVNHPDYNVHNIDLIRVEPYFWDERLL